MKKVFIRYYQDGRECCCYADTKRIKKLKKAPFTRIVKVLKIQNQKKRGKRYEY